MYDLLANQAASSAVGYISQKAIHMKMDAIIEDYLRRGFTNQELLLLLEEAFTDRESDRQLMQMMEWNVFLSKEQPEVTLI